MSGRLWQFWRWKPESGGITSCLISGSWELLWNLVVIVIVIVIAMVILMILMIFTTIMVMGTSEHMDGAGQRGRWVACLGWTWAGFPPGRHHHCHHYLSLVITTWSAYNAHTNGDVNANGSHHMGGFRGGSLKEFLEWSTSHWTRLIMITMNMLLCAMMVMMMINMLFTSS